MGLVVCAHLLVFLAIGRRIPWAPELRFGAQDPPMQVTILRPPRRAQPTGARGSGLKASSKPNPSIAVAAPSVLTQPAPAGQAPAPGVAAATGPPDCEPQDLPLLTASELALCRVALDAERERRLARGAAEKAAKQVARAQSAPHMYRMDADKEAGYDAAAKANEQLGKPPAMAERGPLMGQSGVAIGIGGKCTHATFPLLSGVETNPNLFAKKHKQERPSHSAMTCTVSVGLQPP